MPGAAQHQRRVAKRSFASLETIRIGHAAVGQRDLAVLHDLQRDLVLHLLDAEPGRRLVLDDEALDLVVGDVARPDDRDVAPRSVADPALLAVEDPGVAFAFRRGRETTTGPRAYQRLGQREAADLLHARHGRQPLLLLLLGAREVDGIHRETGVDTMEGTERNVGPRDLESDQGEQLGTSTRAAVANDAETGDVQLLIRRQQ